VKVGGCPTSNYYLSYIESGYNECKEMFFEDNVSMELAVDLIRKEDFDNNTIDGKVLPGVLCKDWGNYHTMFDQYTPTTSGEVGYANACFVQWYTCPTCPTVGGGGGGGGCPTSNYYLLYINGQNNDPTGSDLYEWEELFFEDNTSMELAVHIIRNEDIELKIDGKVLPGVLCKD